MDRRREQGLRQGRRGYGNHDPGEQGRRSGGDGLGRTDPTSPGRAQLHVGNKQGHNGDSATTDAKGLARVRLPPETYEVHVEAGMLSACQSTEKITDGQTIRHTALLTPPPRIAGRVLDPKGQPAVEVEAAVYPFGDRLCTDAQGRFDAGFDDATAPRVDSRRPGRQEGAGRGDVYE